MPVACQSCAPECPQAFGAEGDLPRIISRGMPGARSLRARLEELQLLPLIAFGDLPPSYIGAF